MKLKIFFLLIFIGAGLANADLTVILNPANITASVYNGLVTEESVGFTNLGSSSVLIALSTNKTWIMMPAPFTLQVRETKNVTFTLLGVITDTRGNVDINVTDPTASQVMILPVDLNVSIQSGTAQQQITAQEAFLVADFIAFFLMLIAIIRKQYYIALVLFIIIIAFIYAYYTFAT